MDRNGNQHKQIEIKQTASRITIEGEHICLFILKRVPIEGEVQDDQPEFEFEIEITPILNAPYQLSRVTIPLKDLKVCLTYRYMYERRAIRFVTKLEAKEYIINFKSEKHKQKVLKHLLKLAAPHLDITMQGLDCQSAVVSDLATQVINEYTRKWQTGMLSNAEYLSFLNFAANRSYNDTTQYPIFPWVVSDYKNDTFPEEKFFSSSDQRTSRGWRDLSKPIGSLGHEKLERFKSKYF